MEERRRFPRLKVQESSLRYQLRGFSDSGFARCDDVSEGGISFVNDRFVPRGVNLALEVNLLSKALCFIGKVVWAHHIPHSDRYRIGVEFLETNQADKNFLNDYISMQLGRVF